jgi:hypothetical protein
MEYVGRDVRLNMRDKLRSANPELIMIYAASILLAFAIKYMPKQNL